MVRAILDGRKTQTRRIVKPQPTGSSTWLPWNNGQREIFAPNNTAATPASLVCPLGTVGDRLWVREAWSPDHAAFYPNFPIVYRADFGDEYERNDRGEVYSSEQKRWYPFRWRPSIHMPRHHSRITLEITGVRVERLQDISPDDAIAEGISIAAEPTPLQKLCAVAEFRNLWQSIYGPDSWDANPWVWVVEFKKT